MMRRLRVAGLSLGFLSFALLVVSAQAGAAKPQPVRVLQTSQPIETLAMDGPRVAYMMDKRRVGIWNVVTGATAWIRGNYPSKGHDFGYGTGEVAIAGTRVALITRFVTGNTAQTQERLYTASIGGFVRQIGKLTNHYSDGGDCTVPGSGGWSGNWIGGLVGSGQTLAVSSWNSNNSERLSLIGPTGLRTIATGPGAIVSQSADGGHIAVLRSTDAWPAYQGPVEQSSPMVGVYSTKGTLLGQVALNVPLPTCGSSYTIIRIALSGNQLDVLRLDIPQAGSLTTTVEVYNWTTGALVHTWPLALNHGSPIADQLAVHGRVAVIEGDAFKLRLLDLTTGTTATIAASRSGNPATIGPRGLVYAVDSGGRHPRGELVFVPMARVLALLS
jgi:hypothetical protein